MSLRDLLETGQALALASKLYPDEVAVWERYCREFSNRFHTPLMQVRELDPLFVITQVNADNLSDLNPEEQMDSIWEMIGTLSDPDYDVKKERAIREELRQIEEREAERIRDGRPIHESLVKDKRVIGSENIPKKETPPKELPKSGGININLINQLSNSDNES